MLFALLLPRVPARAGDVEISIQPPFDLKISRMLVFVVPQETWGPGPDHPLPSSEQLASMFEPSRAVARYYYGPPSRNRIFILPAWVILQPKYVIVCLAVGDREKPVYGGALIRPNSTDEYYLSLKMLETPGYSDLFRNLSTMDDFWKPKPEDAGGPVPGLPGAGEKPSAFAGFGDTLMHFFYYLCVLVALASPAVVYFFARRDQEALFTRIDHLRREVVGLRDSMGHLAAQRPREPETRPAPHGAGEVRRASREPARETRLRATEPAVDREYARGGDPSPIPEAAVPAAQPPDPVPTPVESLAEHFCTWCRTEELNLHSVDRFKEFLQKQMANTRVFPLYRDRNDSANAYVLTSDNVSIADAVEYWCVKLSGETLLLPKPETDGFRELRPIFETQTTDLRPKMLASIRAATVTEESADRYIVKYTGEVY